MFCKKEKNKKAVIKTADKDIISLRFKVFSYIALNVKGFKVSEVQGLECKQRHTLQKFVFSRVGMVFRFYVEVVRPLFELRHCRNAPQILSLVEGCS